MKLDQSVHLSLCHLAHCVAVGNDVGGAARCSSSGGAKARCQPEWLTEPHTVPEGRRCPTAEPQHPAEH